MERFWSKVVISSENDCWEWTGCRNSRNYGRFMLNGKVENANRVSWTLHFGPIPEGKWALHKCDNPPCVNPHHLFLGTHKDNIHDMISKGRDKGAHIANRKKTHCKKGHKFSGPPVLGKERRCKICDRNYSKERYAGK